MKQFRGFPARYVSLARCSAHRRAQRVFGESLQSVFLFFFKYDRLIHPDREKLLGVFLLYSQRLQRTKEPPMVTDAEFSSMENKAEHR